MKLDLAQDRESIRKYILERIEGYSYSVNLGPGDGEDHPIQAISLGFYAAQGGYIYLVFDTRPGFNLDGEWTNHIDEPTMFDLPNWTEFYDAVYEGEKCTLIKEDGVQISIHLTGQEEDSGDNDFEDELSAYFGIMLTNLMLELRDDGTLASLPLAKDAFMIVEEFDGHYFWPVPESCRVTGAIHS